MYCSSFNQVWFHFPSNLVERFLTDVAALIGVASVSAALAAGWRSGSDGPTVVKFPGHLDERSLRLMLLFKMPPPRREEERQSQRTATAASIILSTSTLCHSTPGRQMFARVRCLRGGGI